MIDDGSTDATAQRRARAAGARVVTAADVLPELGPGSGKGDVLWKSLHVTSGDVVCWIDADLEDFSSHFVTGLLGPLLTVPSTVFVEGLLPPAARRRPRRRRPGHRAARPPGHLAAVPLPHRLRAAAGGRVRRPAPRARVGPVHRGLGRRAGPAHRPVRRASGSSTWPRSTWACAATATGRCTSWARRPWPSSRWRCARRASPSPTPGATSSCATRPAGASSACPVEVRERPPMREVSAYRPDRVPACRLQPRAVGVRVLYTDIDGTLVGPGGDLLVDERPHARRSPRPGRSWRPAGRGSRSWRCRAGPGPAWPSCRACSGSPRSSASSARCASTTAARRERGHRPARGGARAAASQALQPAVAALVAGSGGELEEHAPWNAGPGALAHGAGPARRRHGAGVARRQRVRLGRGRRQRRDPPRASTRCPTDLPAVRVYHLSPRGVSKRAAILADQAHRGPRRRRVRGDRRRPGRRRVPRRRRAAAS